MILSEIIFLDRAIFMIIGCLMGLILGWTKEDWEA